MKGFLDYLQGDSILHKMHPLTKIFVAALLCASAFVSSNFFYLVGIIVFDIMLGFIGEGKTGSGLFKRTLDILKSPLKMPSVRLKSPEPVFPSPIKPSRISKTIIPTK